MKFNRLKSRSWHYINVKLAGLRQVGFSTQLPKLVNSPIKAAIDGPLVLNPHGQSFVVEIRFVHGFDVVGMLTALLYNYHPRVVPASISLCQSFCWQSERPQCLRDGCSVLRACDWSSLRISQRVGSCLAISGYCCQIHPRSMGLPQLNIGWSAAEEHTCFCSLLSGFRWKERDRE